MDDIITELNRNHIYTGHTTAETLQKFQYALISLLIYKLTPNTDRANLYEIYSITQKKIHTYEEVVNTLSQQVH